MYRPSLLLPSDDYRSSSMRHVVCVCSGVVVESCIFLLMALLSWMLCVLETSTHCWVLVVSPLILFDSIVYMLGFRQWRKSYCWLLQSERRRRRLLLFSICMRALSSLSLALVLIDLLPLQALPLFPLISYVGGLYMNKKAADRYTWLRLHAWDLPLLLTAISVVCCSTGAITALQIPRGSFTPHQQQQQQEQLFSSDAVALAAAAAATTVHIGHQNHSLSLVGEEATAASNTSSSASSGTLPPTAAAGALSKKTTSPESSSGPLAVRVIAWPAAHAGTAAFRASSSSAAVAKVPAWSGAALLWPEFLVCVVMLSMCVLLWRLLAIDASLRQDALLRLSLSFLLHLSAAFLLAVVFLAQYIDQTSLREEAAAAAASDTNPPLLLTPVITTDQKTAMRRGLSGEADNAVTAKDGEVRNPEEAGTLVGDSNSSSPNTRVAAGSAREEGEGGRVLREKATSTGEVVRSILPGYLVVAEAIALIPASYWAVPLVFALLLLQVLTGALMIYCISKHTRLDTPPQSFSPATIATAAAEEETALLQAASLAVLEEGYGGGSRLPNYSSCWRDPGTGGGLQHSPQPPLVRNMTVSLEKVGHNFYRLLLDPDTFSRAQRGEDVLQDERRGEEEEDTAEAVATDAVPRGGMGTVCAEQLTHQIETQEQQQYLENQQLHERRAGQDQQQHDLREQEEGCTDAENIQQSSDHMGCPLPQQQEEADQVIVRQQEQQDQEDHKGEQHEGQQQEGRMDISSSLEEKEIYHMSQVSRQQRRCQVLLHQRSQEDGQQQLLLHRGEGLPEVGRMHDQRILRTQYQSATVADDCISKQSCRDALAVGWSQVGEEEEIKEKFSVVNVCADSDIQECREAAPRESSLVGLIREDAAIVATQKPLDMSGARGAGAVVGHMGRQLCHATRKETVTLGEHVGAAMKKEVVWAEPSVTSAASCPSQSSSCSSQCARSHRGRSLRLGKSSSSAKRQSEQHKNDYGRRTRSNRRNRRTIPSCSNIDDKDMGEKGEQVEDELCGGEEEKYLDSVEGYRGKERQKNVTRIDGSEDDQQRGQETRREKEEERGAREVGGSGGRGVTENPFMSNEERRTAFYTTTTTTGTHFSTGGTPTAERAPAAATVLFTAERMSTTAYKDTTDERPSAAGSDFTAGEASIAGSGSASATLSVVGKVSTVERVFTAESGSSAGSGFTWWRPWRLSVRQRTANARDGVPPPVEEPVAAATEREGDSVGIVGRETAAYDDNRAEAIVLGGEEEAAAPPPAAAPPAAPISGASELSVMATTSAYIMRGQGRDSKGGKDKKERTAKSLIDSPQCSTNLQLPALAQLHEEEGTMLYAAATVALAGGTFEDIRATTTSHAATRSSIAEEEQRVVREQTATTEKEQVAIGSSRTEVAAGAEETMSSSERGPQYRTRLASPRSQTNDCGKRTAVDEPPRERHGDAYQQHLSIRRKERGGRLRNKEISEVEAVEENKVIVESDMGSANQAAAYNYPSQDTAAPVDVAALGSQEATTSHRVSADNGRFLQAGEPTAVTAAAAVSSMHASANTTAVKGTSAKISLATVSKDETPGLSSGSREARTGASARSAAPALPPTASIAGREATGTVSANKPSAERDEMEGGVRTVAPAERSASLSLPASAAEAPAPVPVESAIQSDTPPLLPSRKTTPPAVATDTHRDEARILPPPPSDEPEFCIICFQRVRHAHTLLQLLPQSY